MAPRPDARPNISTLGQWLPPKALGNNLPQRIVENPTAPYSIGFQHDGALGDGQTRVITQMPSNVRHYKTFSVYHYAGIIWAVAYDATTNAVGDGRDSGQSNHSDRSESENDDDEEFRDDWRELSFTGVRDQAFLSYAGLRLPQERLLVHHPAQLWAHHFLPDRYMSQRRVADRRYGGLVGELPLLIALAALSQPKEHWNTLIAHTIVNQGQPLGWQVHAYQQNHLDRGQQWTDPRGIVVTVYKESGEDLEGYEKGRYGRILP